VIRRFYSDWYRPDLQAIIAVGDFDVKEMQQKIVKMFSAIPAHPAPRPRHTEMVPDHTETKVSIVTDKEARMVQVMLFYKHPAVTEKSTLEYSRNSLMQELYNNMLNARLGELVQQAEPPFIGAMSAYRNYVKSADMYMAIAYLNNPDPTKAIQALVQENARVLQFGFTQTELERAKKEFLASFEKRYNERTNRKSEDFCWEYYGHFLNNEPIPGIDFEYDMVKQFLPSINVKEVNALAHDWITDKNRVVVLTAPEAYASSLPDEATLLRIIDEASKAPVTAYEDAVSTKPLHNLAITPGTVKKTTVNEKTGHHEWVLSNGAKVVIKPTKFKEDEILFAAYSKGGTSLYENNELITAQFTPTVIDMGGIGEFNNIELGKLLADKMVRISPYLGPLEEGFNGSSTPRDLVTMLELVNLYFMQPRADEQAFRSFMARQQGLLQNRANDPGSAFSDTLTNTLYKNHPRKRPMTADLLSEADYTRMSAIFNERFSNASDWTFYFVGNIDPTTAKPLIEKYIGSIPGSKKSETWIDRKEVAAEGVIKKRIETPMQVPKATVAVLQGGKFDYSTRERMLLSFINEILDQKYTETIREKEGGTYGVSVQTNMTQHPSPTYRLITYFTCAPERADELTAIIYQQIELMKSEGPTQKEMNNVIENKLKERTEMEKENRFWMRGLRFMYENGENTLDTDAYNKLVRSITIKDVQEATKKYYSGKNVIEIIQLPKE
jgi:zinc protease